MILALGIKYFLDNDLVQNALVPKLWSQGVAFTSNFSVAVSALGYKGACVGNLTVSSNCQHVFFLTKYLVLHRTSESWGLSCHVQAS